MKILISATFGMYLNLGLAWATDFPFQSWIKGSCTDPKTCIPPSKACSLNLFSKYASKEAIKARTVCMDQAAGLWLQAHLKDLSTTQTLDLKALSSQDVEAVLIAYGTLDSKPPLQKIILPLFNKRIGALLTPEIFQDLTALQILSLPTPKELIALQQFLKSAGSRLETLEIHHVPLGKDDVRFLIKLLPSTLKILRLTHAQLDDAGAFEMASFIWGLDIQELDLSHNRIGPKGLESLMRGLTKSILKRVDLRNNALSAAEKKHFQQKAVFNQAEGTQTSDEIAKNNRIEILF